MAANGSLLASVPNFAHWYPRLRVVLGLFDYDRRGILDATHIRFFTRRSFEQLIDRAGFAIVRRDATGLPLEVADRGLDESNVSGRLGFIRSVDRALVRARPQLFGYQFLYELVPAERG